ncbi:methyl-accepting chemotaxis protein [Paenibacillus sp. LMG 31456]|uniref:Methyl-accepting chemotaxis protein n=1 Tax=Paenibacillus foliorum TaxID=2654974 RepID=A0A972GSR0_9BACL|nr:methyl-accepting chemotaxis protein [Paenibacillus foliorum]NOU92070.1 methyl-accepting chemotaxis protein [Paenibacillus foliorum]
MFNWLHSITVRFMLFTGVFLLVLIGGIYVYQWQEIRKDAEDQLYQKGSSLAVSLSKTLQSIAEDDIRDGTLIKGGIKWTGEELRTNLFNDKLQPVPGSDKELQKRSQDKTYAEGTQTLFDGRKVPLAQYEQKYTSAYDIYTDDHWQKVLDSFMTDNSIVFAVAGAYSDNPDFAGFVATHNTQYSSIGDDSKDAWGTTGLLSQKYRSNRVYNDAVGYADVANKDTSKAKLQKYPQIVEGKVVERWVVSYPITIDGKHWGAARIAMSKESAEAMIMKQHWKIGLELALLYVGVLVMLFILSRVIVARKLNFVLQAAVNLNSQEADLTYRIPVRGKDELARLSEEINRFIGHLQEMIGSIRFMSVSVGDTSNSLSEKASRSTLTSTEISHTVQELATGAQNQATGAKDSVKAMEEMALGIQRIAEAAAQVTEVTQHLVREVEHGNVASERAMSQMTTMSQSANEVGAAIQKLEEGMQSVGAMAQVISGIASQTGLLALNAAIEAARAGEQGKGFAVVASEVRKLADQSEASAQQINEMVTDIQIAMRAAVTAMETGGRDVRDGVQEVTTVRSSLERMLHSVHRASGQMEEVSAAAEQMSAGTEEVAASIEEMARIASTTSEYAGRMAEASQSQLHDSEETSSLSGTLSEAAQQLKATANRFKV